jgi:hypothetical protein
VTPHPHSSSPTLPAENDISSYALLVSCRLAENSRRYERASTLLTSNRPVEDWGKLLGDTAAVSSMLDRILHHGHVLKCGPRSWRTKTVAATAT